MPRPKKDASLKRSKAVMAKFTENEHALIAERAAACRLPVSTYVHDAAIGKTPAVRYELAPPVPELAALAGSLGKTAGNLNQIARHLNGGGYATAALRTDIRHCIAEIYGMRRELAGLKRSLTG